MSLNRSCTRPGPVALLSSAAVLPVVLLLASGLGGCASGPRQAESAGAPQGGVTSVREESPVPEQPSVASDGVEDAEPLRSLDDAERAYAEAQRDLDSLLGPSSDRLGEGGAVDDDQPPKAGQTSPSPEAMPLRKADDRCQRVCLALASLERARDAICRITSADDERCTRASVSAEKNRERAKVCACPAPDTKSHDE